MQNLSVTNEDIMFSVVFTNLMWNLEYAPMRGLDNIAILTETVWEEDT